MIFGKSKVDKEAEIEQRNRIIAYKRVFGGEEGRSVLFHILNRNFVLNSHKGDAFSEGRRAAALDILTMCNINIEQFDAMLKGDLGEHDDVTG